MKSFTSIIAAAGLLAAAQAQNWNGTVYTTVTVDQYVTVCPYATTFTQGPKTYTATAGQTITVTDCPCTLTKPVWNLPTSTSPANKTIPVVFTTATVSTYVTVCPTPTVFTQGSKTYTVTKATTLTITDCPCTISYTSTPTVVTSTVSYLTTYCPAPTTIVVGTTTIVQSTPGVVTIPVITTIIAPPPATTPVVTLYPTTTPAVPATTAPATTPVVPATTTPVKITTASATAPAQFTGAANKIGSGFAAVAGGLFAMML